MSSTPSSPASAALTDLLQRTGAGDLAAKDALWTLLYDDVRAAAARLIARGWRKGLLQPTAVANEVYIRLCGGDGVSWESRRHFWGAVGRAMVRILCEQARSRRAREQTAATTELANLLQQRSDNSGRPDVEALDQALRRLEAVARHKRKAEVVRLRYFAGRTPSEIAHMCDVSEPTIKRDLCFAKAWLKRDIQRRGRA